MIFCDFKDFIGKLPKSGRIMAVDWGLKRTGIAISDETRAFAFPRPQISPDALMVAKIAEESRAAAIILGIPAVGAVAEKIKEFAKSLESSTHIPILLYDETLSSVRASEILSESNVKARNQKGRLDSAAAMVILEEFLERIKNA